MSKQPSILDAPGLFTRKGQAAPAAPAASAPSNPVGAKRTALTVKLDPGTYGRLRKLAFTTNVSHQDLLERAVLQFLRTQGAE